MVRSINKYCLIIIGVLTFTSCAIALPSEGISNISSIDLINNKDELISRTNLLSTAYALNVDIDLSVIDNNVSQAMQYKIEYIDKFPEQKAHYYIAADDISMHLYFINDCIYLDNGIDSIIIDGTFEDFMSSYDFQSLFIDFDNLFLLSEEVDYIKDGNTECYSINIPTIDYNYLCSGLFQSKEYYGAFEVYFLFNKNTKELINFSCIFDFLSDGINCQIMLQYKINAINDKVNIIIPTTILQAINNYKRMS